VRQSRPTGHFNRRVRGQKTKNKKEENLYFSIWPDASYGRFVSILGLSRGPTQFGKVLS